MNCCLFGHRTASSGLRMPLKTSILKLIEEHGVKTFYVGNNGNFDYLAQFVLSEITNARSDVRYYIVLSAMGETTLSDNGEVTLFPEGLETTPPRFAIYKRNDWLIKNSQYAIVYVETEVSNCYKWMKRAMRKGVKILNLAVQPAFEQAKNK
ncbi:MAG: hypothetical protein IJF45_01785 [Clostridia bacterium]|nr:hypothetical protein [Clostridia bacterium]